ncbi:MAG: exodeoxyribonuclease VII large subunit [Clostridiales Family XIII bacterium]|nr:exodeoxyribonuclease VII large subunit [Clostridiales Family XIII bacterium]
MRPISVSQLNAYIRKLLHTDPVLGALSVMGEISNLKLHGSGHVYFTLKDAGSRLNCFLAQETAAALRYTLEDGMEVVADGYISLYERGGYYSLAIRDIRVEGQGGLAAAFERLKSKLAAEGLFDAGRKRPIPEFPRAVAIVTSGTGAALQDMLKILGSRNRLVDITVCPAQVQGPGAAADIADAMETVNRLRPDTGCMIVGRGGGSAEELWAFNEEIVARGIYASRIPVISAVGHETDFTIADFVADRRAETPTAAAQMAVPDAGLLADRARARSQELHGGAARLLERLSLRLAACGPESLGGAMTYRADAAAWRLSGLGAEMARLAEAAVSAGGEAAERMAAGLRGMDPRSVLDRGYAMLSDSAGNPVPSVARVRENDALTATLRDGSVTLEARGVCPGAALPRHGGHHG